MGKIQFIDERCFGCGACWSVAPENFTCSDTGRTVMINDEVNEKAIEASEICPASAIIIEDTCNCENCECGHDCSCEEECNCDNNCNCTEDCSCGCQDK